MHKRILVFFMPHSVCSTP